MKPRDLPAFCTEWFKRNDFEVHRLEQRPGRRSLIANLGQPPVIRAEPFWTDCALLDQAGIPCLLFGVAGAGAHAATEYVDLASLDRVTDVLAKTIIDFSG